jgi:molybdopterin-guanine dinucleotide biosynthesis protein A
VAAERTALITGIVLAGGRSRRFGRDKLIEPLGGEPMLFRPIRAVAPVCDIVLVSIADPLTPPPVPADVRVAFVADEDGDQGPLGGLVSAIAAAPPGTAVVVGGDMPAIADPVLRLLIDELARDDAVDAVALSDGESVRPLPCALRVAAATPKLRAIYASGERRLRALVGTLRTVGVPVDSWRELDPSGSSLADIDRPEDLPG